MYCGDIIQLLEKKAPPEYAMDWDHVGLLVGHRDKQIHKLFPLRCNQMKMNHC